MQLAGTPLMPHLSRFALGLVLFAASACGSGVSTGLTSLPDGGRSTPDASVHHVDAAGDAKTRGNCTPTTCSALGATCGAQGDGCGGTIHCGSCTLPETCGGGGQPSVCGGAPGCTPTTCAAQHENCGPIGDGCGGMLECGTCTGGQACGAGGVPSVCGTPVVSPDAANPCVPKTCAELGASCGPMGDGCGNLLLCGNCPAGQSCGLGGTPSVCGSATCAPKTCAEVGASCGPMGDGCGGLLQCGVCPSGQACGAGGVPSQCGSSCVPETCASLGYDCGAAGDGCGNLLQCGSCAAGATCGGGGKPNVCGVPGACTGLCLQQVVCSGTATTSVTGTVYAPNGTDPLYGAIVYVPNAPVLPFAPGVACAACGADVSGSPLVEATTGINGQFTLTNMPVGANIPLVIQLGRWRRQVVIPNVAACTNTVVPATLTHMPQSHAQGDIPKMAFVTGALDALECVFRKIGIADAEFTDPGGAGRLQFFQGAGAAGAIIDGATPLESQLWGTQAAINEYDQVLFACQGAEYDQTAAAQQVVINFANAGGRVFATHYSYVWLFNDPPFSTTAQWQVDQGTLFTDDPGTGLINTAFPTGLALAQWLQLIGASTVLGQIPLAVLRHDFDAVVPPSTLWMTVNDPTAGNNVPMHYEFLTPVGAATNNQCGRVVYEDFHVEDQGLAGPTTFPTECVAGAMTPQEKLLEFIMFDLASCVAPAGTCVPKTCAEEGFDCGPEGDGCGNVLQCGACPSGQLCGGAGIPGVCGAPVCQSKTCASLDFNCGPADDGCGNLLDCGTCPAGQQCGAVSPSVCGVPTCTPATCASLGFDCGPAGDGCGNELQCGTCTTGNACGAAGNPGVCAPVAAGTCVPSTCVAQKINCGPAGDGCGGELQCGTCNAPDTCGGGGVLGQCGASAGAK